MLLNSPGELTLKEGIADVKIPPPLFLLLLLLMLLLLLFLCFQCLCVYVTQHVPFLSRKKKMRGRRKRLGTHAGVNIAAPTHVVALRLRSLTSATYGTKA
jgi:hypothetical protein